MSASGSQRSFKSYVSKRASDICDKKLKSTGINPEASFEGPRLVPRVDL